LQACCTERVTERGECVCVWRETAARADRVHRAVRPWLEEGCVHGCEA
jgi:hypothetical protein